MRFIFAMTIPPVLPFFASKSISLLPITMNGGSICLRCWALASTEPARSGRRLEVWGPAFSTLTATFSPPTFRSILTIVLGVTLTRRRLAYPGRQHFEIDQFVEIDRGVRHSCSLR